MNQIAQGAKSLKDTVVTAQKWILFITAICILSVKT